MKSLLTVDEASALIKSGKRLLVAGDESLLASLPRGQWMGGTTPYFMSEDGGLCTHHKVQVVVLPDLAHVMTTKLYSAEELSHISADYTANGFSYIVIPAFSEAHQKFAKECSTWRGVFDRPLVGWIAGIDLNDLGKVTPKVVDGQTGEVSDSKAAVMHIELPADLYAQTNIINLFRQGDGDTIRFPSTGFEVTDCCVNGQKRCFAEYLESQQIDIRQPLVANYHGAMVNVSFQAVDAKAGKVALYAPVFACVEYRVADPLRDYAAQFCRELERHAVKPVFTCNCVLNYLYANLEGKKTANVVGPMTFGEIAYMLLNQTMVYLTFEKKVTQAASAVSVQHRRGRSLTAYSCPALGYRLISEGERPRDANVGGIESELSSIVPARDKSVEGWEYDDPRQGLHARQGGTVQYRRMCAFASGPLRQVPQRNLRASLGGVRVLRRDLLPDLLRPACV